MNASFRTAFWAMCLGLVVPMVLFVGTELTSGGRARHRPDRGIADQRGSLRDHWRKTGAKVAARKSPVQPSQLQPPERKANRRAEPPLPETTPPEIHKQPAVVLGPSLETDPAVSETVPDRRIPARTMADRPRVDILPEPETNLSWTLA